MAEQLTCTVMIRYICSYDNQGKPRYAHRRCAAPAAEYEVGGLLGTAKAVLCVTHKLKADKEAFVSSNGYPLGKIDKAKDEHYQQQRLPGTGVKS